MRKLITLISMAALAMLSIVTLGSGNAIASPVPGSTCTGSHSGGTWNSVVVPSNSSCTIDNSWIGGSVLVNPGSSFETCNDHIVGSISANSAYLNIDHGTWVGGSISTTNPGATTHLGQQYCETVTAGVQPNVVFGSLICPYHVGGSISEQNLGRYSAPVLIGDCFAKIIIGPTITTSYDPTWVGGSVLMAGNRNHVTLENAYVVGNVTCVNDNPNSHADYVEASRIIGCDSDME